MLLGGKLGLYTALAKDSPMDAAALAKATGTAERYIREWVAAQAASGYVEYDCTSGKFSMLPEQILALAAEDSLDEPKIADALRTDKGVGWNKRSESLFCGTARFFRTSYKHYLVQDWLPRHNRMSVVISPRTSSRWTARGGLVTVKTNRQQSDGMSHSAAIGISSC
ncbi:hypothetical protein QY049_12670 [Bradyrhizobium sp. WYCCWR 13022]|uniref:hypothetical protein n=1 Tax=unclassified Bradyrhizobium TaxID=2631580 RepID=UPI00263ACBBB|nr:hypothetical protein [Bradyrhizobium sp. WYCCWR 13022]MDN4984082.1 hypothetical protein [Bradyrhizobium sp. WYCCWR 13022]